MVNLSEILKIHAEVVQKLIPVNTWYGKEYALSWEYKVEGSIKEEAKLAYFLGLVR